MYKIGLEDEKANVHVIHMTKNVVIKLHDDNMDLNCSIIGWFIKGLPMVAILNCANYGITLQ